MPQYSQYYKCLMMIMLILVATIHFRLIVDPGIGLGKHLDDTDVRQTSTLQVALTLVTLVTLALISKCYPCSSRRLWHSFLCNHTMCQAKKYIRYTHICEARSENPNYLQPIVSLQSSLSSSIHQEPNCPQTIVHCNNHCTGSVGNVLAIVEQAPRVALGM